LFGTKNKGIVSKELGQLYFVNFTYLRGLIESKSNFKMSNYYNPEDLKKFGKIGDLGASELAENFFGYYGEVFKEGALSEREKALIALAVSHAIHCPYCIDAYTVGSLEKGADEDMIAEAIHVAAAIRGGATLVHGVQAMNKVKEITM